jgi:tRNA(Ile)-lysidine synthase
VSAGFKQLIVCHLDHGLRPESHENAWMVGALAEKYGLPFETERVDVRELAKADKLSIETAGRTARYEFFSRTARTYWCPRLLVAHHADDQVETLLLNLLRGSGRIGLAGMRPLSIREIHGARLEIHRPLLGVWRDEVTAYAQEHELKFQDDPSNTDRAFVRNRIRHDVLPALLSTLDRDVKKGLWRTAEILAAEEEWLESATPPPQPELQVCDLNALPVALQRRLIHRWLQVHKIADVSFDDVEGVRSMLENERRAKVNLSEGRHARRRAGRLFIE